MLFLHLRTGEYNNTCGRVFGAIKIRTRESPDCAAICSGRAHTRENDSTYSAAAALIRFSSGRGG